jgi:hypothetical protein
MATLTDVSMSRKVGAGEGIIKDDEPHRVFTVIVKYF